MKIDIKTMVMGILGNPLGHSLSPLMHNRVMERLSFNGIYIPFPVAEEHLGEAVAAIRALGMRGVNVTIPYKEKVIPFLDGLTDQAQACGAVNLIENRDGLLIGHNMDGPGFMASLRDAGVSPKGEVLILGAGGAARAISYSLSLSGVQHITIAARRREKAQVLADFINRTSNCQAASVSLDDVQEGIARAAIIVNCTSVGMVPHSELSPLSSLENAGKDVVLCDIVYNPLETKLLAMGRARGLKTIDGLSMLVYQGALSLTCLSGIEPPVDYMRNTLMEHFSAI